MHDGSIPGPGGTALWKLPQLWKSKSNKEAFGDFFLMISTSCLEKPPQKRSGFSTVTTAPPTAVHNETLREQESKKRRHKIQANPLHVEYGSVSGFRGVAVLS